MPLTANPRHLVAFAGLQLTLFPIPIITLFCQGRPEAVPGGRPSAEAGQD